jgi:hypothetical protein
VRSERPFGFARLVVGLAGVADGGAAPVESGLTLADLSAMDSSARIGDFECKPSVVELTSVRNSERMPLK